MLFSEIYGSYFRAVAAILEEAVNGTLREERINEIVREKGFGESVLNIPAKLKSGEWALIGPDLTTPLKRGPSMPLSTLQVRWMKALLSDPRVRLFSPSPEGLEDAEPLYAQDAFVYFDRYMDGDPFGDEAYIRNFRAALTALREKRKLDVSYLDGHGKKEHSWHLIPHRLEYSAKDDKFRLIGRVRRMNLTINMARIVKCEAMEAYTPDEYEFAPAKNELVMELVDERNALERAMLHFSHLEKETERLENDLYRVTLRYQRDDEIELLIRVLSFGPKLRVISPPGFIEQIKERLNRQKKLRT
ncbi:MAG: WYL domain-containing protein [Synergistaceae bacterium]|nr:WYL domain-containing protein [Synergistaceae bacterium]